MSGNTRRGEFIALRFSTLAIGVALKTPPTPRAMVSMHGITSRPTCPLQPCQLSDAYHTANNDACHPPIELRLKWCASTGMVPSFVPDWWKIGAPDRMKLGTLM